MKEKVTAKDFMITLKENKKYQEIIKAKREKAEKFSNFLKQDQKPILESLMEIGINTNSVWDLVNSNKSYTSAIKILLENIKKDFHPRTKAGIARALAIPEAKELGWDIILDEYQNTSADEDIDEPNSKGYKEGLAVALAVYIDESRIDEVIELIKNKSHKSSRILLVDALTKYRKIKKVKDAIDDLRDDKDLCKIINKKFKIYL